MPKPSASTLEVVTDPRIELLGVVQSLADGAKEPALERRFGKWRAHPAVAAYRARAEGDSRGLIALCLSDPPELSWVRDRRALSVDFVARAGGDAELDEFLDALRDFASASRFMEFHGESAASLERARLEGERRLSGLDRMALLEEYAGVRLGARFRVIWTERYRPGALTSYIFPYPYEAPGRAAAGPFEVFTIPTAEERKDERAAYLWSEPLCIPVERLHAAHEDEFARLAPDAKTRLVSALSWRLTLRTWSPQGPPPALAGFKDRMEPATFALCRRLEEYENGRASYPALDAFFPRLLDVLAGRKAKAK